MAIELEQALRDIYTKLPEGHPDRRMIHSYFGAVLRYNERAGEQARRELDRQEGMVNRFFSPEARQTIEKAGGIVAKLTGLSIKNLELTGFRFYKVGHSADFGFEYLPSRESHVAVFSKELFLPHSQGKTLDEQETMVAQLSMSLAERIPGVKAIIGQAPDYAELDYQCLTATGRHLFDPELCNFSVRTKTPIDANLVADIGPADPVKGLKLGGWFSQREPDSSIVVVPLIVPA